MPVYRYRGRDADGAGASGLIEAETPEAARLKLRRRTVFVTACEPASERPGGFLRGAFQRLVHSVGRLEVALVTRQLATLLAAGVRLPDALATLAAQGENRLLEAALRDLRQNVLDGRSLADGLARHRRVFGDLSAPVVEAGEAGGNLPACLVALSEYHMRRGRLEERLKAALTYPLIVVIVGAAALVFLLRNVIPKIAGVIAAGGGRLPGPTRFLLGASAFLRSWWPILLLLIVAAAAAYRLAMRREGMRSRRDRFVLSLPLMGRLLRKTIIARVARAMSLMLESGISLSEALGVAERIAGNRVYASTLSRARSEVEAGGSLAAALRRSGEFPPVVVQVVAVGEEGGDLAGHLRELCSGFDEEVEIASKRVTAAMEPIAIVVIGVIVLFVVLAVLLPLVQMSGLRRF